MVAAVSKLFVRDRWHKGLADRAGITSRRRSPKKSGIVELDKDLVGIRLQSDTLFGMQLNCV